MRLYDLAAVMRSKNSGPYAVTVDVLFRDADSYRRVKDSGVWTAETVAERYGLPVDMVTECVCFDAALGMKATMLRQVASGTVGDRDVYGAQQHAPLMDIEVP